MKIIPLTTGTLQVKPTFLEGSPSHGGSIGLIMAIARDAAFTGPLPMWSWIIETSTERILIDAGANSASGGGPTRTRFDVVSENELVPQLRRLGLAPRDFDRGFLTHLHGDHVGALDAVAGVPTWVAAGEWAPVAKFPGKLMRRMTAPVPRGFAPRLFEFDGPSMLGFPGSHSVTSDGSIVALPTPGHSPGHTSYLVRTADGDAFVAGDVTYDLPALMAQREQGFIANVEAHRQTLPRVRSLVESGVVYLPSHDPESPARLDALFRVARGRSTRL
jgi:N-acyl homoserine lactone hydrolase